MELKTLNENEMEKDQAPDLDELLNGDIDEILDKWLREETPEETSEEIPVQGGSGNGSLQRALNAEGA